MGVKVPTYDNFQARPTGGGTPTFSGVNYQADQIAGKQNQQLGQATEKLGDAGMAIQIDIKKQADASKVDDVNNKLREYAFKRTYDPQMGYQNLKGDAALTRPGGVALPEEYDADLRQKIGELSDGLANDEQRRLFSLRANDFATGFKGDVEAHMLREFQGYNNSVADGDLKLSLQDAELNWNNPSKIDTAINGTIDTATGERYGGVKQSIYKKAQLNGMSASEAQAAMNVAESSVHAKVVKAALLNGNITYANSYMDKYKEKMTAEDILDVQGQVTTKTDAYSAVNAASDAAKQYGPSFNPTDMDRLTGLVMGQESAGRRYEKDGVTPLTSSAGAKGEMQVMDGTNLDPGYGVEPAKDDSLDERARVGRDYLKAMVVKYGNIPQALAAYNAGPGTVDNAIAAAKKAGDNNWMAHLKDFQSAEKNTETLDYVDKIGTKFSSGLGAPRMPSQAEFVETAVEKLGPNPRMEALAATREQANAQYKLMIDARKQQGDLALETAQQQLIANGGNFNSLPPQVVSDLARYDPAKYDDAMKFAKAISSDNVSTNMEAYSLATQHPEELAAMSEPVFQQFLRTSFDKGDQEKIVTLRTNYMNGTSDDSAKSIASETVNQALNIRLKSIGINPAPKGTDTKEAARIGSIQKFVRDDIYKQQEALGRKMNPKEVEDRIDTLFNKSVDLPGVLWGKNEERLITMTYNDIPGSMRVALKKEFKARGIAEPSDDDILQAYWRLKNKGKVNG